MKRATISLVAKRAGVSPSTVSNFINGRYGKMSEETKKRIEEVIKALNYTPNISARRLSTKEIWGIICLVIPINIANLFDSFYYPTVLSAVGRACAELDYNILIYIRGGKDSVKEIEYLKGMYGTMADGFLLFDLDNDDLYFREFDAAGIPYVCVGKFEGIEDYPYIATDHEQAVVDAVNHLAALGHKKIAFVCEKGSGVVLRGRQAGYEKAMLENGCAIDPRYMAIPKRYQGGSENRSMIERMLVQEDPPTAVISSVTFAADMEQVCEEREIGIPDDLSVVLLDFAEGNHLRASHYTYTRSIADVVARCAFLDLLSHIKHPDEAFQSKLFTAELIIGKSTIPPNNKNNRSLEKD